MFTGIVQSVESVIEQTGSQLSVTIPNRFGDPIDLGESIAINGCCLTATDLTPATMSFAVSPETCRLTNLGALKRGGRVNFERAMMGSDRFGGHIVQGHVDTVGKFLSRRAEGNFEEFRFEAPAEFDRYLIDKGSIAIDGVSLTIVRPAASVFECWLVPFTLEATTMGAMSPGQSVNLEFDYLAKIVERLLAKQDNRSL